ncbi:MAG TPA: MarR family transcriptional regulator [Steroidobacter sp.]|uniref:MarR family winged helix-turn-helix transcriptional regulator n=1 Tax=Steroidobacter sp. TaxID=1978227 RepID=UPI002EDAE619
MPTSRPRASTDSARARTSPASETFQIADYPFYRLSRVAALYTECLDRELKPRGMDQPRWRVLMILNEHDPAAMGLIAELAVMKLPTLLKVVRRMEEEGLVRTGARLSDQRVTEVSITARGRKSLSLVRKVAADVYEKVTAPFSVDDIETLNALLGNLESSLLTLRRAPRREPLKAAAP